MTLRVVFMGTPGFSVPTLRAVAEAGHEIAAVYTRPPRAAGRRGLSLTPSPVQAEADRIGIEVRTPSTLKDAPAIESLAALGADVGVVVAYGLLLPQAALDALRRGCLNGHASLLPRWRGAAPIQRAVEAGDRETGMMVMRMEAGLDTGPVAVTKRVAVGAAETAGELGERLSFLSAEAMVEALVLLEAGGLRFEDQASIAARTGREPVYAAKIDKRETRIDFTGDADAIVRRINAFSPFPGAWTEIDFGAGPERVKLLRASAEQPSGVARGQPGEVLDDRLLVACGGHSSLRLLELQRAGGRTMAAADWLRGNPAAAGARFGGP